MTVREGAPKHIPEELRREADVLQQDGALTRAGYLIKGRRIESAEFGMEVLVDQVVTPNGEKEKRRWFNFPHDAVMVVPFELKKGKKPKEATVFLAKDLRLYGLGIEDGIEALDQMRDPRKGLMEQAMGMVTERGLRPMDSWPMGTSTEITGRGHNMTHGYAAEVKSDLSPEKLDRVHLLAVSYREALDMVIGTKDSDPVINNAATGLFLVRLRQVLEVAK